MKTNSHCTQLGGKHSNPDHLLMLADCMQICRVAADFMMRGSSLHYLTCTACAEVCEKCADDCEKIGKDDKMMMDCVKECRACAKTCREMAKDKTGQMAMEYRKKMGEQCH